MRKRNFIAWPFLLAAVILSTPLVAQESGEKSDADSLIDGALNEIPEDDSKVAEPAKEGDKASETAVKKKSSTVQAAKEGEEAYKDDAHQKMDPSDPLYWSTMRDVYSLQKRAFQKDGRFSLTLYGGIIPNNIFESYVPVGLRLNYFVLENIGIELSTSYSFSYDKGLADTIQEDTGVSAQQVLVADQQVAYAFDFDNPARDREGLDVGKLFIPSRVNFGVVWSPFYGKTAFYNSVISYFDFYLFAGAGLAITQTQRDFNAPKDADIKPEGALGAGMAFYLGQHLVTRLDFRQFVFAKVNGGVANPSEISLGLGYFF